MWWCRSRVRFREGRGFVVGCARAARCDGKYCVLVLVAVLLSGGGACGGVVVVLGFGRAVGLLSGVRGGRGVMGLRVRRKWPAQKIPYLWMAGAAKLRAVFCLHVGAGFCPLPPQAMRQSQNRWAIVSATSLFLFVCLFGTRPGFAQFAAAQDCRVMHG